jgi:hypothetical protein
LNDLLCKMPTNDMHAFTPTMPRHAMLPVQHQWMNGKIPYDIYSEIMQGSIDLFGALLELPKLPPRSPLPTTSRRIPSVQSLRTLHTSYPIPQPRNVRRIPCVRLPSEHMSQCAIVPILEPILRSAHEPKELSRLCKVVL